MKCDKGGRKIAKNRTTEYTSMLVLFCNIKEPRRCNLDIFNLRRAINTKEPY